MIILLKVVSHVRLSLTFATKKKGKKKEKKKKKLLCPLYVGALVHLVII
jgi:hypothetical protein